MNEARNSNHFCAETVPAHIAIGLEQWRSTTSERLSNDNANQRVAMCPRCTKPSVFVRSNRTNRVKQWFGGLIWL